MIRTTNGMSHHRKSNGWHIEKPFIQRPQVSEATLINGSLMYVGVGKDKGKIYFKELFDKMFSVVKGQIFPKYYKGKIEDTYNK
jgi:hypothetical protein